MKLLLGTKNKHKIDELLKIINEYKIKYDLNLDVYSLNDFEDIEEPVEDGNTFAENALIKAKYYYDKFKIPTLADDSGIVVEALGNLPGIYSARYASIEGLHATDKDNRTKLLNELKNTNNRNAYFYCSICVYSDEMIINEWGKMEGEILKDEIGTLGFGYDPIFYSFELKSPLGIVLEDEKNKVSHRGKALRKTLDKITNFVKNNSI